MVVGPHLRHEDADHLLGRIHPEVRAERTTPAESSVRLHRARGTPVEQHAVAETEAETAPWWPDLQIAGVVRSHQLDGLATEQTTAVELTALEHHLLEAEVVERGRDQAAGAHEERVRLLDEPTLRERRVGEDD